MIMMNQIALNMCYLIVLGKTFSSWSIDVFQTSPNSIFANQIFYILVVTVFQCYWYYKKQLQELKIVSQTLFVAFTIFIVIVFVMSLVYEKKPN